MKKTSILSILWLAGLLTFIATPSFAQEAEEAVADEAAVVVEDTVDDAADVAADEVAAIEEPTSEEAVAYEAAERTPFEEEITSDPELVNKLNQGMDEVLNALDLPEDERAELESQFKNPEERALVMAAFSSIVAGAGLIYLICAAICALIYIIALWFVFKKAGEKGWKAIIPIYNEYITYKIAGIKNWFWWSLLIAFVIWFIAGFFPAYQGIFTSVAICICGIIAIVKNFKLARNFNWGVFTSILFVLFNWICVLILWFGKSQYKGDKAE